jgi:hypothetical protein
MPVRVLAAITVGDVGDGSNRPGGGAPTTARQAPSPLRGEGWGGGDLSTCGDNQTAKISVKTQS